MKRILMFVLAVMLLIGVAVPKETKAEAIEYCNDWLEAYDYIGSVSDYPFSLKIKKELHFSVIKLLHFK